jgi:hypothetical protein
VFIVVYLTTFSVASNSRMINAQLIGKEVEGKVLVGTEEDHEKPQSR